MSVYMVGQLLVQEQAAEAARYMEYSGQPA